MADTEREFVSEVENDVEKETDSGEPETKRSKTNEEPNEASDAPVENSASTAMNGTQKWINGKWIFRYNETDSFMSFEDEKGWQPVKDDDNEFIMQLWQEQEAAEKEKAESSSNGVEVNDDFLAQYHLNYGVQYDYDSMKKKEENGDDDEEKKKKKEQEETEKHKGPRPPGWVDMEEKVNAVYVSNLPLDINHEEFMEVMSKCGVIQNDARTNKPKAKLYLDEDGNPKGDARCCYVRKESIELALNLLDESDVRGKKIKVERAHFEMKGEYDPKKKRRKLTAAQKKRYMEQQNKHFEWRPEKPRNYRPVSDCTVVIKGLFTLDELNEDASRLFTLKDELNTSCQSYGTVKKVTVYDNNPEGVATVSFTSTVESDKAVTMLNGRVIKGRPLVAHLWDGKTKYKVEETEEQAQKRLEQWNKYVEAGGSIDDKKDDDKKEKKDTKE